MPCRSSPPQSEAWGANDRYGHCTGVEAERRNGVRYACLFVICSNIPGIVGEGVAPLETEARQG